MWPFRKSPKDDDDLFSSDDDDYDSDEYETDGSEPEELDSEDDSSDRLHGDQGSATPNAMREETTNGDDEAGDEEVVVVEKEDVVASALAESGHDQGPSVQGKELGDRVEESYEESNTEGDEDSDESDDDDDEEDEESDEEEATTSLVEKQSLLALAVEHDRVDILKAILAETEDREQLLNDLQLPPLHVAVSYGSTNATSCLLRMGANPAIRPQKTTDQNHRYEGVTAWQLAFGDHDDDNENDNKSWFGMKGSSKSTKVDMAPSKREGIRHAFTAEALRCIGSDEAERLKQLLDSGMPSTIDIGGKTLHGWCIEMGAKACRELTKPEEDEQHENEANETVAADLNANNNDNAKVGVSKLQLRRVATGDTDSLSSLGNRLEELEALARALSICLDNLAEEVSVCHGLLLLGGGASALATHVRSLKVLQQQRRDELNHWETEWSKGEEELEYWMQQSGGKFDDIAASELDTSSRRLFHKISECTGEEEEAQRRQMMAQIGAIENKIRKLRASIADLSEESARDLEEVEKRGLSGGIKLVRSLREELRELEFRLSEAKSGEAACRARISLIATRIDADKKLELEDNPSSSTTNGSPAVKSMQNGNHHEAKPPTSLEDESETPTSFGGDYNPPKSASEKIASGDSVSLVIRQPGASGYLTLDLWQIILRIIGLGRVAVRKSADDLRESTSNVMIV